MESGTPSAWWPAAVSAVTPTTPATPAAHVARAILAHFDAHRRRMPWRETADPYAIWVSEVMLQQTRVDTVRPYYDRWMRRFPSVADLADAEVDEALLHWQGLGYYGRARNLHRAARLVRERHGGEVPRDIAALRALPGIGEYTAGAVASIAFGTPAPAVDGNARRVLARLYDIEDPSAAGLRRLAADLVPATRPGDFNQALMELGATICTPRAPTCTACPVAAWCRARARGVQESRPRARRRTARLPHETIDTSVLVRPDGRVLLVRRPATGLLAGLWEFPGDDAPDRATALVTRARPIRPLEPVHHVFSHKAITYRPTLYAVAGVGADEADDPASGAASGHVWAPLTALDGFALPVAQQKIAAMARAAVGGDRDRSGMD